MFDFSLEIRGLDEWRTLLGDVAQFVTRPFRRSLAEKIRDDYADEVTEVFATKGKSIGRPWPPLAPSTVRQKALRFPGRPPLVRTGEMSNALTRPTHPKFVFAHTSNKITLGSRDPVAPIHQTGTKHMLARPVWLLTDATAKRWAEGVVEDWHDRLKEKLRGWIT